ncbi:lysozyme c-1-like isoform X2 [Dermacentor albipictus]|uniref:lysozyme c-1-like isoform X2 n=1 Tax=Dermacentor albipictus TaxID=60249 RepID=UPI0038FD3119
MRLREDCRQLKLFLQLLESNGFAGNWFVIPKGICLATAESSLNSKAVNRNRNHSTDYGIFQINNGYWCSPGRHNICKVSCSALKSDNILPSIKCAKQIYKRHGFNAWYGWKRKCKGKKLSSYVKGCRY